MASRGRAVQRLGTQKPVEDEKKIHDTILKQARQSGQLNLSGRSLTAVPESVWRINTDLPEETQSVSLDSTEERWWEQTDLTKLILASNLITTLGEGLAQLPALTVLDVHDNRLISLPDALGSLQNLQKLDVSRNQLQELPACLGNLRNLVSLHVEQNKLKQLCPEIADLYKLEELDVSHNALQELPICTGNLSRLVRLNVSNNKLSTLPPEIGAMNGLRYFDATHNELMRLPEEFGELRNLEQLYLRHNCLLYLPVLHSCVNLKELHLGNNSIKGLSPDHLQHLVSVTFLDLRDNKIAKLPDEISLLQGLERLDLSNNDLTALPFSLGTISSLKSVVLDGNPLKSVRRDIIMRGTVELKKYLNSRMQELEVPSPAAPAAKDSVLPMASSDVVQSHELQQFKTMDFSNQKAHKFPADVWEKAREAAVAVVNLSKNQLTQLPSELSVLKASLTELNVGFNKISTLSTDIGLFVKLVCLDLRNNCLSALTPEIGLLQALREVILSHNRFTEIPRALYQLKKLEILFLNDNKINEIHAEELQHMPVLATLDLRNNNISQVPPELGNCLSLRSLQIGGNPFRNPRPAILEKGTTALLEYLRNRIVT